LRSDYVDYFFVHEPHHTLTHFEELRETAERLKVEGRIRAWGLSFMQVQRHLHESYVHGFDLLQFNKPTEMAEYNKLVLTKGKESNIIFSPLRSIDTRNAADQLVNLSDDFPKSVILCSMFNAEHLKQNIQAVDASFNIK